MSARPRSVFVGSGRFGLESLRRLVGNDEIDLVGVVTAPARPVGRRQTPTPTPVHAVALELGVSPILTPDRLRAPAHLAEVRSLDPELVVLADYGQIVPPALLDLPFGALNLHPSLLPRHRGASPIPATILSGDAETGVTLMRMDAGLDTGPIVAVERVPLTGHETAPELEDRLEVVAADVLERSLGPWIRAELEARPQPAEGATLTRPLRREDGRLDPDRPAAELERRVRAYAGWPGTFVDLVVGRLIVTRAHAAAGRDEPAGTIVAADDGIALATADGMLVLDEVQPAGGRPMTGAAFRRGRPGAVGTLVSPVAAPPPAT